MPNCSAPISKTQKKLLRILNCLFQQYIICKTPSTKAFFANPSQNAFNNMSNELNGIAQVINASSLLAKLSTTSVTAYAKISVYNANAVKALDTSESNTMDDYARNSLRDPSKEIAVLDTDECINCGYRVKVGQSSKPGNSHGTNLEYPYQLSNNTWANKGIYVTDAIVAERIGCAGVSNTGYLRFDIEVDINAYPFNPCQCNNCDSSSSCSK